MRLLLNTGNDHKTREMREICSAHTLQSTGELGIDAYFEETGTTFLANALGKARTLADTLGEEGFRTHRIDAVIADDSGISVAALDGRPGVYSARYGMERGGKELGAAERNALLLEELVQCATKGQGDRSAWYSCCMVGILADGRVACAEDRLYGEIAERPSTGSGGFGYDPVFRLPERGCTVADISDAEKHRISHRGRATRALLAALEHMLRQDR